MFRIHCIAHYDMVSIGTTVPVKWFFPHFLEAGWELHALQISFLKRIFPNLLNPLFQSKVPQSDSLESSLESRLSDFLDTSRNCQLCQMVKMESPSSYLFHGSRNLQTCQTCARKGHFTDFCYCIRNRHLLQTNIHRKGSLRYYGDIP